MNLDNSPFDSPQKETIKSSILKNRTDNKENMKKTHSLFSCSLNFAIFIRWDDHHVAAHLTPKTRHKSRAASLEERVLLLLCYRLLWLCHIVIIKQRYRLLVRDADWLRASTDHHWVGRVLEHTFLLFNLNGRVIQAAGGILSFTSVP